MLHALTKLITAPCLADTAAERTSNEAALPNTSMSEPAAAGERIQTRAETAWASCGINMLTADQGEAVFVRVLAQAGMRALAANIVQHLVSWHPM